MVLLSSVLLTCSSAILSVGCGSSNESQATSAKTVQGELQLSPATVELFQGESANFVPSNSVAVSPSRCTWHATDPTILSSKGSGGFLGTGVGSSSVTATCDGFSASALAVVSSVSDPNTIKITSGGIYSGNWSSTNPKVPAVTILTDKPVVLQNSKVSGPGDLIVIYGSQGGGANVTIENVTGTALDPGVSGAVKGRFVAGENMSSLSVTHCTMHDVSFGVYVASSKLTSLTIRDNAADNLDDRKSDGNGGYLLNQRALGHFIQFNGVSLPNGGEIAWNQMINSDGKGSIEDIINIYQSQGSRDHSILIHDNYLQGAFATGLTKSYTGSGIQMDGGSNDPSVASGFVQIQNNTIVHLAGPAISIAAGHDISVTGNRVVSCGKDSSGKWIDAPWTDVLVMSNYYGTNQYFNNYMANNSGGMIRPDVKGNPTASDIYAPSASESLNNVVGRNVFKQPCFVGSSVDLAAESAERNRWLSIAAATGELLGDQH